MRGLGPWLRLEASTLPLSKALNFSLLPNSLYWQSDGAVSPCSQLLGFKSSKIPLCEPRLPSQLSFTCQPSWPNSCVLKAINQAVFTPYPLVCVLGAGMATPRTLLYSWLWPLQFPKTMWLIQESQWWLLFLRTAESGMSLTPPLVGS